MALSLNDKKTDHLPGEVVASGNLAAGIQKIGEHCAALPDYHTRSPDEIDEPGMWN